MQIKAQIFPKQSEKFFLDRKIIQEIFILQESHCKLPIFGTKAPAGFPSPADDYIEDKLSLDEILIKHPAATYLVRVSGNSMLNEGIHDNDLLVVDRSLKPQDGKIVVVAIDGEITVKKLQVVNGKMILMSANPRYKPIEVKEGNEVMIWGVVKTVIHNV